MTWHEYFFEMCDISLKKSKDNSTQVGAVIVGPDHEVISTGYNDFPRGAIDDPSKVNDDVLAYKIQLRRERPLKYKWTEHAERNAIYNAARRGIATKGCEIYVHSVPVSFNSCTDCCRSIIQSGLIKVHYKGINKQKIPEQWKEDFEISTEMFEECGVEVIYHD